MSPPVEQLTAALADRYRIEREIIVVLNRAEELKRRTDK
jgi:hypothetical protein